MDSEQDQGSPTNEPQRHYIYEENITVNVHNRNAETKPLALTDFKFHRLELGPIIDRLGQANHIVLSVAYNGNVADIVIIANANGWGEAFFG